VRRLGALALLVAASGCAVDGLAFRVDDRVEITAPADRAQVSLPVTIEWTGERLDASDGGPFFAVFVDRAPIKPGQSLRALADDSCNRTPGCPDLGYLEDRFVFLTDGNAVTLDAVPERGGSQRTSADDRHEATIVLVDGEGRRIGEAAYTVEFTVEGR
jgi:hypothetical protein